MRFERKYEENGWRVIEGSAPAKINIFLRIKGKRPDGFHELQSLMVPLSLGDFLTVRLRSATAEAARIDLKVDSDEEHLGPAEKNLTVRAAKIFQERLEKARKPIEIVLEKRTPIGAGLGGGSSDGAFVLCALNEMIDCPFAVSDLAEMAVGLGADVPFFLHGKPALAEGIGERIHLLERFDRYWFVLTNPGFSVSTPWVFQNLDLNLTSVGRGEKLNKSLKELEKTPWPRLLENDLETVTIPKYPVLQEMKTELMKLGAEGSLMSGSGPTVFGIFSGEDGEAKAKSAFQALQRNKDWKVFLTHNI